MAQRSLNKVQLIGNLTRDPELRYTPQGTAVCTLGLATNRTWVTDAGEKREDAEFHRLVAWSKLAELCSQLLFKGRKIYVEGRLQTRQWTGQDGSARQTTEIVVTDMIILDSKRALGEEVGEGVVPAVPAEPTPAPAESAGELAGEPAGSPGAQAGADSSTPVPAKTKAKKKKKEEDGVAKEESETVSPDDIPF